MTQITAEHERIRTLNDQLRQTGQGGRVMHTVGITSLPQDDQQAISQAVAVFSDFTEDNDPYGEHDCALIQCGEHRVYFKIDYYDPTLTYHSDDPTDSDKTVRVMTIMLATEY